MTFAACSAQRDIEVVVQEEGLDVLEDLVLVFLIFGEFLCCGRPREENE